MADDGIQTVITKKSGGSLVIDCTISTTHTKSVDITQHPIEDGENVSDNMRPKPDRVSLVCFVSDNPPEGADGNVVAAYAFLKGLKDKPELVKISTRLEFYEDMGLANEPFEDNAQLGDSLQFTLEFQHVSIVSVKKQLGEVKKGAPKKTGKQAPQTPTNPAKITAGARLGDAIVEKGKEIKQQIFGRP